MTAVVSNASLTRVPKERIRTIGYDLASRSSTSSTAGGSPRDFVARNSIEVRVDDVARAGEIVDARRAGWRDVGRRHPVRPEGSRRGSSAKRCASPSPTRARAPTRLRPAPAARWTASQDRGSRERAPRCRARWRDSRRARAVQTPSSPDSSRSAREVTLTVSMK